MLVSHVIRLYPTAKQEVYFRKACGTARFAYNWALAEWNRQYEAGEKPNWMALSKQLNSIKREQFPWMAEVTKCSPQQAIRSLGKAFSRFFARKARYPKFKKKGDRDSFHLDSTVTQVSCRKLLVSRLGRVTLAEPLRFQGHIVRVTIFRQADFWFAAVLVEVSDPPPDQHPNENQVVGADLGIKTFAMLSTGEKVQGPNALKKKLGRLRRAQKKLSRRKKGSGRRERARREVARIHYRVRCVRQDFLHKLTTRLVKEYGVIVIEDLNVRGMSRNHKLARSILDQGFGEFRRQLEYKALRFGSRILVADRFYPSSKTCSTCGHVLSELSLKTREWTCPMCGQVHDRDLNAAINLRNLAGSSPVTARGATVRPANTGAVALKREINKPNHAV